MRTWPCLKVFSLLFFHFIILQASAQSPGGVSANLNLWLKANAGLLKAGPAPATNGDAITVWQDQSGSARDYAAVAGPTLQDNTLNFNPSVEILAGGFDAPATAALGTDWTVFFISQKLASDNNGRLFDGHTANFLWAHWGNYTNGIYLNANPSEYNSGIATTTGIQNLHLHSYKRESVGGTLEARADGASLKTFGAGNSASGTRIDINQGFYAGSESSHSRVGEMIIYNTPLSATDVDKVESYLGVKYGLTLAHNYIASDGTILWNNITNAAYHNNVTAIGRDNTSQLNQSQSRSLNARSDITISGAIAADLSFLVLGDNNAANGTSSDAPGAYAKRLNKIWKTAVTGAPGAVDVTVDLTDLGLPIGLLATEYAILIDGDATTLADAVGTPGSTRVGNQLTFSGVNFSGSQFFTVAVSSSALKGPANVTDNLKLWLKAGSGVTGVASVTGWNDQSGNAYNATTPGGATPALLTNQLNFNPVVDFTNSHLKINSGIMGSSLSAYTSSWTYAVLKGDVLQNNTLFYESLAGGETFNVLIPWGNNVFLDFGNTGGTGRINGVWGGNLNAYNMWTIGSGNVAASTPNLTNKAIARDGSVFLSNNNNDNTIAGNKQPFFLGGGYNTGLIADGSINQLDGKVAELIVFTGVPSALEQEKIQTYLGVKYGITKNSADVVATDEDERDYFSSIGSVIWDYDVNATYHNRVTGIGRDDASQLNQLKSQSIHSGSVLALERPGSFGADRAFVVVGDDNGMLAGTATSLPAPYTNRVTRIWRSDLTGTPGGISVSFDLSTGIHNSGKISDYALLINNNTNFSTASVHTTGASIANNVLTFTNVTFADGDYFTLGLVTFSPGGVATTPVFWVTGGSGVTGTTNVSQWADQSGGGNNAVQVTPANQPALVASDLNFNPSINFSGNSMIMSPVSAPANLNSTVFTVAVPNVNSSWRTMFRGSVDDHPLIIQSGGTALGYYDNSGGGLQPSGFTWLQNEPALVGLEMRGGDVNFRKNGTQGASITSIDLTGLNLNYFGNYQGNGQQFGKIAETIIYNTSLALTITEKNKIESYLAVKYGLTLTHDYLTTAGTISWNQTTNSGYNNRVMGIGRDDLTNLDQRKSKAVVGSSVLAIEKTTPANAFTIDQQFLLVGDDAANLSATTTGVPTGFPAFPMRVARVWKTQVSGTPGTVTISFDLGTGIYNSANAADYSLLIGASTDFSAVTPVTGGIIASNVISFSNVTLADGEFFTLGLPFINSPGNVVNNLTVWLKANEGVLSPGMTPATDGGNVGQWTDQTSLLNHGAATAVPFYNTTSNLINFNPTVYYDGTSGHNLTYSVSDQYTIFTMARLEGTQNGRVFSSRNSNSLLGYWNNRQDVVYLNNLPSHLTGQAASTNPRLYALSRATNGAYQFYANGGVLNGGGASNNVTWQMGIGNGGQATGEKSKVYVSEMIIYDRNLSAAEINSVQSYLGIKYGITLDQTTPTNYVASDGSTIWDATASPTGNASFKNNIAGIGRDDDSKLNQLKSQSINAKSIVTMEREGGSFASNKTFLMWGNDSNPLAPTGVGAFAGLYPYRVNRVWRVDETGTTGTVSVSFDLSVGIFNSGTATDYALLIKNANTDFSSGATAHVTGASFNGSTLTFTNVTFADGDYFTLGLPNITAPGGVVGNVQLWLKANAGVTDAGGVASAWTDQSGNGFNVTQTTNASRPAILTNQANFNPAIKFDGADDQLTLAGGIMGTATYNDFNAIMVSRANANVTNTLFYEVQASGGRINIHVPWNNNNIYWDAGDAGTNRLNGTWGGAINNHFLWSLTASTTATSSGAKQDIYKNGLRILNDNNLSSFSGNNSNFFLGSQAGNAFYNGDFSEVILYTGALSSNQLQRINSYFALKYGLTLDQSVPQNYIASNSSIFYHASSTHTAYSFDIAGIGRDDNSALDQRKSQTANTPSDIFAAANNDFATPAPFGTNLEFLVWGHNGLPATSDATVSSITHAGSSIVRRLARTWSTDKTGTHTGNLIVELDVNQIGGPSGPGTNATADLRLLLDDDAVFGNASVGEKVYTVSATSLGKIYFTIPYADVLSQSWLTLGSINIATAPLLTATPGGIAASMRLWLKGNVGATAALWTDNSGNGFDVSQATPANQPSVLANRVNFNPSVVFNGTNQSFNNTNGIFRLGTYVDANVFIVSRLNTVQNGQLMFESNSAANFITYVPWGDNNVYWDAGNSGTNRLNGNWGGAINQSYLWSLTSSANATQSGAKQDVYRNGLRFLNDNTMFSFIGNNSTYYLGSGPNTNYYNGEISEVIVLSSALTTSQFQRVHSYLAIKYGITLNQITAQNYFSSTDAVVYHATTTHAGYRTDIAGIGRDDNSALDQRKSKSINTTPDIITVANGDFATPTIFANTQEFLMWGHNGLPYSSDAATATYTHGAQSIVRQLARLWSTDKTGSPSGNAIIEMDMSLVGGPGGVPGSNANADVRLVVDNNATFGEGSPTEHAYSPDGGFAATGGVIYFTVPYADIASGQGFFTLGSVNLSTAPISIPYPGGVASNIKLWMKANAGVTGGANASAWADQSGNGYNAVQATGASQPTVLSNRVNFNPALQFDGANDRMSIASGVLGANTYSDVNAFVISRTNAGSGQVFREATTSNQLAGYFPSTDNNVYWDAGSNGAPYRLVTNWGGTLGTNYLWSLSASTTTTASGARQDIYRNALRIAFDNDMGTFTGNNSAFTIASDGGGNFHNGEVSELALYTGALTATQTQRIHSYMALKYGLTLDQSTAQDYLASNGISIYHTTTTHNSYKNQIAGIGRDDDSALDQRKSKSVNTNAVITMEKGSPASAFAADKNFVVWGDDALSNGPTTIGAVNATYPMRITKAWRVDTQGTPGQVTLSFDLSVGIYNSTIATDYALLIKNANNDFTSGATIHTTGVSIVSGVLTFTNVSFADGDYFTLAMPRVPAPGGVIDNLRVWLKANSGVYSDAGTTPSVDSGPVQQWTDQTQLGNNGTNVGSPTFYSSAAANLINFNPTVYYNGTTGHNLSYNVSGQYTIFTMSRMEGTQNRRLFSSRTSNYLIGYYNGRENVLFLNGAPNLLTGVAASTTPRLYSFIRANTGAYQMLNSGGALYSGASSNDPVMQWSMGTGGQSGESSRAFVSESIIYDRNLGAAELSAVQSYLAIKYGITIDQTAATNYVSADGTVIWNGTTNATYKNNVAGIGRDDRSALDQRKSRSINTGSIVTIDKASVFGSDKMFVVWGSDANLLSPTSTGVVAAYPYRLARAWRASVTNAPGTVSVSFDLTTGIYNSGLATDYGLMVKSADANFSTGAVTTYNTGNTTVTLSAGTLTFSNVALNNGDHFSLALPIVPAPGGVVDGMHYWIKANQGVTGSPVSSWTDQSGNGFVVSQGTTASQPALASSDVNFNPSVVFDGSNDQLVLATGVMGTNTYNNFHSFIASRTNVVSNSSIFFETQNGGGRINVHLPWGDNVVYWDAGSANASQRLNINWGGAVGTNYLWGFTSSTTATPSGARQDIYRNGLRIANDPNMTSFTGNNSPFNLGSGGGGTYYNGALAENVFYTNALSASQLQRIQSYFAVKYGTTLNQSVAQNYYASDWNGTAGTIIWNSTSAGTYRNDIAAIGRDNNSALYQKQSASVNAGNILIISNGAGAIPSSNVANASTFGSDKAFFSWAHNNLILDGEGITDKDTPIQSRIARVWQGQETGVVGTVHVKFNLSTVSGVGGVIGANDMSQVRLLVDSDGIFATGATVVPVAAFDNVARTVEFDVNFPDGVISYFTVGSVDKATAPLPIQLVSFTATAKEDQVVVTWKTVSELDNDFFTVQSSMDGFEWAGILDVKGAGNSSTPKTYEITDETPFIGKSYYRLMQTDFDGKTTYSKAVEVTINEGSIKVFPNPVSDGKVTIQIKDNLSDQVQIRLLDSQQRELKSQTYQRNTSQQSTITIDLPEQLPSGMYYLKIIDKTGIRYKRIIVN